MVEKCYNVIPLCKCFVVVVFFIGVLRRDYFMEIFFVSSSRLFGGLKGALSRDLPEVCG